MENTFSQKKKHLIIYKVLQYSPLLTFPYKNLTKKVWFQVVSSHGFREMGCIFGIVKRESECVDKAEQSLFTRFSG